MLDKLVNVPVNSPKAMALKLRECAQNHMDLETPETFPDEAAGAGDTRWGFSVLRDLRRLAGSPDATVR